MVLGNRRSQAAEMVLKPGKSEGDRHNRHRGADQWLFVDVPPAYDEEGDELSRGKR